MWGSSDFENEEFYGPCIYFEQRGSKVQEELRNEVGSIEYAISAFVEDTEERQEAKLNLEEKEN